MKIFSKVKNRRLVHASNEEKQKCFLGDTLFTNLKAFEYVSVYMFLTIYLHKQENLNISFFKQYITITLFFIITRC